MYGTVITAHVEELIRCFRESPQKLFQAWQERCRIYLALAKPATVSVNMQTMEGAQR